MKNHNTSVAAPSVVRSVFVQPIRIFQFLFALAACSLPVPSAYAVSEDVVWTADSGVSVSGSTITKNTSAGWGNSGAVSDVTFDDNGWVDFTVPAEGHDIFAGLSYTNADEDINSIDYGVYVASDNSLQVYELGTGQGSFGTYVPGDRIRIQRKGSTVYYKKNGITIYESTVPSSGTMMMDTALYSEGGVISGAKISGITIGAPDAITTLSGKQGFASGAVELNWIEPDENGSTITDYDVQYGTVASGTFGSTYNDDANPGATVTGLTNGTLYQFRVVSTNSSGTSSVSNMITATPMAPLNVTWASASGVTVSSNTLTKNTSAGWGNSGAVANINFGGNNGVDFTVAGTGKDVMAGLSYVNTNNHYTSIDYALHAAADGYLYVYELGAGVGTGIAYTPGDRLRVERIGTSVYYKKNGQTIYISPVASTGAMFVDAALYSASSVISDAKMAGIVGTGPDAVTDLFGNSEVNSGEVILTWSMPINNGAPITGYQIQYGTVASGAFASTFTDDATPGAVVTGLTDGVAYQFRVVATNTYGTSSPSNVVTKTPMATLDVVWASGSGVTITGNTLTKNTSAGWGNSGAVSNIDFDEDGGLDFTVTAAGKDVIAGLASTNPDESYSSIDYAVHVAADGNLYVYELGSTTAEVLGTYVPGDRIRIERTGTTVYYKKNGVTFYTSPTPSTGALMVDAALYSASSVISDAKLTGIVPGIPDTISTLTGNSGVNTGEVRLNWAAPSSNGDAITGYQVQYGTVSSGAFASTYNDDASPGATITGLTDGVAYQFRVVPSNTYGSASPSNVVTKTPMASLNVVWASTSGVSVSSNTITKNTSAGWGNSGAVSNVTFSGDGGFDFTVAATGEDVMAGLSTTNPDESYSSIDYAVYLANDGTIQVYELGVTSSEIFGTYVPGDRIRVERTGTTINYKKNGVTFYTSETPSSGAVMADAALYSAGSVISDAKLTGIVPGVPNAIADLSGDRGLTSGAVDLSWSAPDGNGAVITAYHVQYGTVASGTFGSTYNDDATPGATITGLTNGTAYQFRVTATNSYGNSPVSNIIVKTPLAPSNVTWTNATGVSVSSNTITKTGSDGWDAGASSTTTFSGDGSVDFKFTQTTGIAAFAGLAESDPDQNYESINYALYATEGSIYVVESGGFTDGYTEYTATDRLRVERIGSTVSYKKNGVVFYTSTIPSNGSLRADTSLYYNGNIVSDAKFVGISANIPDAVTDLSATVAVTSGQVQLSWTAPDDNGGTITGYKVQYGTVASGAFGTTYTDNATAGAVITGLTNGTAYQFRVLATNSAGDSNPSNVVTATPNPPSSTLQSPPGGYVLSTSGGDTVTFTWNPSPGATGYQAYVGTSPGASDIADSGVTPSTSFSVSGISMNGSPIYVRLFTYNGGSTFQQDRVYNTSSTPVVRFRGAGSGHKEFSGGGITQTVDYTLDVSFGVQIVNADVVGDVTTYDLARKTGVIYFQGTAEHTETGNNQIFSFERQLNIDINGTEGELTRSASNPDDVNIEFDIPATSTLPYAVHVVYSGLTKEAQVTFVMPFYWNDSGGVDNVYSVGATDDLNDPGTCSIDLHVNKPELVPGETANATADTVLNHGQSLKWELTPVGKASTAKAVITADASGTSAVISDVRGQGDLELKATNPSVPGCVKTFPLRVKCDHCGGSDGILTNENNTVNVSLNLGSTKRGNSFGKIFLNAAVPSTALSTPAALNIATFGNTNRVIYSGTSPRQIVTDEFLVNIIVSSAYEYEIRYYPISDKGAFSSGVYQLVGGATPVKVWTIENPDASPSVYNQLTITESGDPSDKVYEYTWDAGDQKWTLAKGSGLTLVTTEEDISGPNRIVTETVEDGSTNVASVTRTTYGPVSTPDGISEEVLEVVEDPSGDALTTTTTWVTTMHDPNNFGKIASQTFPDGSWVRYEYDSQGRTSKEITPWLDTTSGTIASSAREVSYSYASQDGSDDMLAEDSRKPRLVTEKILNQIVGKTFYVYQISNGQRTNIVERALRTDADYGDSDNLRTTTVMVTGSPWRVESVTHPDGTKDSYAYETGTYTPDGDPTQPGSFSAGAGTDERTTVVHGTSGSPAGVAYKTGSERSISNSIGQVLLDERYVYNGSSQNRVAWTVNQYDESGHLVSAHQSDGTYSENDWTETTLEGQTDRTGIEHRFTYDAAGRLDTSVKEAGTYDVTTTYTYDGAGRRLSETVTSNSLTMGTSSTYDLTGRILTSTDDAGLVTDYDYSSDNRTTTVTRPGGATEITEQYRDGQTKDVTGTGVVAQYITAGVNSDGSRWTKVNVSGSSSPNYEKTTVDMAGRTIAVERPGYTGTETTEYFYNDAGQLARVETPGLADTLYEYDSVGNQVRSGLDINDGGTLVLNSTDRISDTDTVFTTVSSNWWQETTQKVYPNNNATPTTTSVQRSRLSGFTSGLVDETVSTDINGNVTTATTTINRGTKTQTRTVDVPDSDTNAVSVTVNGLLTSDTSKTNVATTFGYDALERQTTVTDPRTGAVTTAYHSTTGQVTSVTDAASNATSFTYDSAGRKATETNDLGDVTRFSYNDRDQVTRTWGDVPYPTEYVYDDYGLLEEMRTWRSAAAWTGGTWPTGVSGSEDITTWGYQEATGLLLSKTDDDSESTDYTYTTGRKLYTRTWARGPSTTYGYDSATGELLTVNYSDSTPDVTFTYDRMGRISTVADGFGSRTFAYTAALAPDTEIMSGLYSKTITHAYAGSGVVGRPTGLDTGTDYTTGYTYDSKGRYNGTTWTANSQSGSASYTFVSNSDLVDVLTMGSVTADYAYEANRNLRTQVLNKYSSTTLSQYDYAYDDIGRRTSVKNSGTAFAASAFNLYGYNDRSELTGSNRYLGTNLATLTSPVAGETRAYTYDPIGNRTAYTVGANNGSYSPTNLNQYGSESVAGGGTNTFTHDDDGNLTGISGVKNVTYTYDAENRLITAAPTTPATNDKKIDSTYDYMGRRVQKVISNYNGSSWVTSATKKFVYDGWNVVEEQTASGTTKYYVWGLDLSQSLQGAGGIGGLLAKVEGTPTHNYVYDGNGNVGQLIDASDGSIDAHYEYDPYGNSIVATGAQAAGNTYRFSTKYLDTDYGLYYYGYRFFDSLTGRWVNRDPIEEDGGLNLYGFVRNAVINSVDIDGRLDFSEDGQPIGSDLQPNWGRESGALNHTRHKLRVVLENDCMLSKMMDETYVSLKNFTHFNNNIATVRKSGNIAWFNIITPDGFFMDMINPHEVPVMLTYNDQSMEVSGQTLGNHMLVGVRKWRVSASPVMPQGKSGFLVETESYDRPRGLFNRAGMWGAGKTAQLAVWTEYFTNIKDFLETNYTGVTAKITETFHESLGNMKNPWQPN